MGSSVILLRKKVGRDRFSEIAEYSQIFTVKFLFSLSVYSHDESLCEHPKEGIYSHELESKANYLPGLMISSSSLNVTLEFFRFLFGL